MYENLGDEYEDYKRRWNKGLVYPQKIIGKYMLIQIRTVTPSTNNLEFQKVSKLHWVKIYFSTPTFDCITKDLKANFITKISTVGRKLRFFRKIADIFYIQNISKEELWDSLLDFLSSVALRFYTLLARFCSAVSLIKDQLGAEAII